MKPDPDANADGTPAREHPGPTSVSLPAATIQRLIDHARGAFPNEACGVIVGDRPAAQGGRAIRWEPTANQATSPFRFEIPPEDLVRLTIATDEADEVFWAIVHSHTHTAARPSATDVAQAFYPDALYVLVSLSSDELADGATPMPTVRAWRIVDGEAFEVELLVEAGV